VSVASVSVEVAAVVPVTSGVAGLRLQTAGPVAPAGGVTAQVKGTIPVNPFDGVTEITDVFPVVAPAAKSSVVGAAVRAKPGVAPVTAAWMPRV